MVELLESKCALHYKWIYQLKKENDDTKKYKARLDVKGFQQREGIDFNEIFSPIVKLTAIKFVLSIMPAEHLHLEQLDVKTAFLHDDFKDDIYMLQTLGYIMSRKEQLVCKLKKSLYGLK